VSAEYAAGHWFEASELAPLGAGHIHDTYEVQAPAGRFVLQRVNHQVFERPELVMAQTERLLAVWRRQERYVAPRLVPSRDGMTGQWVDGEFWRVWEFVPGTRVVDPLQNLHQAAAAGTAFGSLQHCLRQLPGPRFEDPIPGFLQLSHYLQAYDVVAGEAPADLRAVITHHRGLARLLGDRNATIHGDCKINNLLFDDAARQVVAIIDFDTAMYGHWAWDFGDLVRSVCFSFGRADTAFFAAALQGFASQQPACTVAECVAAPGYVTLMLGVRFLTDHLQGDQYFRVARRGDNLVRAEQQFALFEEFLQLESELRAAAEDVLD